MFNVAVLKMKDIKKYLIGMLVTIVVVILVSKYFPQMRTEKKIVPKVLSENSMIGCLEQTIPAMSSVNEEYKKIASEEDILQGILKTQISSIQGMETIEEKAQKENAIKEELEEKEKELPNKQKVEIAQTGNLTTQVITNNPLKESYNAQYGKVKIKNETEYQLTR